MAEGKRTADRRLVVGLRMDVEELAKAIPVRVFPSLLYEHLSYIAPPSPGVAKPGIGRVLSYPASRSVREM